MFRHVVSRVGTVLVVGALGMALSGTAASAAPARPAETGADSSTAALAFGHWERTGTHTSSKFLCEKIGQVEWPLFPTDCYKDGGQWYVWVFFPW